MHTGALTLRRFAVLVRHLPAGSATGRALAGGDHVWQPLDVQLLARLSDQIAYLRWDYRSAHRGKDTRVDDPPQLIARPGVVQPGPAGDRLGNTVGLDMAEVRAYLDRFKPRKEEADGN